MTQQVKNLTSTHEDVGSIPDLAQWVKALVWLWLQPAAAAPFQPPNRGASICHTWSPKKEKKKQALLPSCSLPILPSNLLPGTSWLPFSPRGCSSTPQTSAPAGSPQPLRLSSREGPLLRASLPCPHALLGPPKPGLAVTSSPLSPVT